MARQPLIFWEGSDLFFFIFTTPGGHEPCLWSFGALSTLGGQENVCSIDQGSVRIDCAGKRKRGDEDDLSDLETYREIG